jgi:diphosphoinositol-polyphosphate diphosphatase
MNYVVVWSNSIGTCRPTTAGVRGIISSHVTTIKTATVIYHVYEMEVTSLDTDWLERKERRREWVDYSTAISRLVWKPELRQALMMSSLAPVSR